MDKIIDIENFLEDNSLEHQTSEDLFFLRNSKWTDHQHKEKELKNIYKRHSSIMNIVQKALFDQKHDQVDVEKEKYSKILEESFDSVSPLIYLSNEQRKAFLDHARYLKFSEKKTIYSGMEGNLDAGHWAAFILLEGEVHIFDNQENFKDLINRIHFFGYDGPIFSKRFNTVLVEKNSVLAMIPRSVFVNHIHPFSKFCTYISRRIINKDKVLDDLTILKNYILNFSEKAVDMYKLIKLYRNIDPCLHPNVNKDDIDFSAWTYALNRLPQSVLETYVFLLVNKPPKLLSTRDELAKEIIPRIPTAARNRDVYRYLEGKNIIVVREMETDVLDFISNMCIHMIEAGKLRKLICSPITVGKLFDARGNFDQAIEVLKKATGTTISEFSYNTLKKVFGDKFAEKLISLCLHYQDYSISIFKMGSTDQDPVEQWMQNLWNVSKELLGINRSVEEVDDLVVDIFQGSKRTLLGCISPHIFMHQEEILKWGVENNIKLKTKHFLNENDKLLAYSYYYYKTFPEKAKEKDEVEKAHGVAFIEQTFSTGVQVLVINTNKLDPRYVDPCLKLKPASKNHIILHIGYTFGAQSSHIVKPILMLFGSKARSMNIIGKAGGLAGNRTDILVADKMFYDKTHDLVNINYGNLDVEDLKATTKSNIHVGPMLTVAGTVLQNNDLLNFYKIVMGCIGLEMEGFFFVREIESSIKHGLLKPDFITRCFYYASDLPLDPNQNLAQEDGNVSWDEGVGSMNAIQRYILKQVLSE
jgi:hypothetical protein